MRTKSLPIATGEGELRFSGFTGPVGWRVHGEIEKLKMGPARLRGAIIATAEVAKDAFRAGEGLLVMPGGEQYRLTMLGHSAGADEVFVELRV